jgi:hypothetical protein
MVRPMLIISHLLYRTDTRISRLHWIQSLVYIYWVHYPISILESTFKPDLRLNTNSTTVSETQTARWLRLPEPTYQSHCDRIFSINQGLKISSHMFTSSHHLIINFINFIIIIMASCQPVHWSLRRSLIRLLFSTELALTYIILFESEQLWQYRYCTVFPLS